MKNLPLTIATLFLCPFLCAHEFEVPPPVELLLLPHEKIFEGDPKEGAHGEKDYCYDVGGSYTVYSENLVGEGYSFSRLKPNQGCLASKSKVNVSNQLALSLGTTQAAASELLGVKLSEGFNTVTWHYRRPISNQSFDDFTTLNVTIKNGEVYAVSIFNTVTN